MKIKSLLLTTLLGCVIFTSQAFTQNGEADPVSLEEALKIASSQKKKILVDVYAEWCPYCGRMHSEVYPDEMVRKAIADHFVLVKINVESEEKVNYHGNEMTEAEFARALENENVPTTYFMNEEGTILGVQPGYIPEDTFSELLNFVGSDAYLSQTFEEFRNR